MHEHSNEPHDIGICDKVLLYSIIKSNIFV